MKRKIEPNRTTQDSKLTFQLSKFANPNNKN